MIYAAGLAIVAFSSTYEMFLADLLPGADSIPSSFLRVEGEEAHGLRAGFWTSTDFFGEPFVVRVAPQVALNFGFFNFPGFGVNSTRYPDFPSKLNGCICACFTGRLIVPKAGSYRPSLALLGTCRVFLDDTPALDFRYHGPGRTGGGVGSSGFAGAQAADDDVRGHHSEHMDGPRWRCRTARPSWCDMLLARKAAFS